MGLTSTLLALLGYQIDVVCYSKLLSDRDFADFKPLFEELGLQEDISYGTFVDISNKMINKNGDIRKICEQFLLNPNDAKFVEPQNQKESILLIDEVDVFFSSDFYG